MEHRRAKLGIDAYLTKPIRLTIARMLLSVADAATGRRAIIHAAIDPGIPGRNPYDGHNAPSATGGGQSCQPKVACKMLEKLGCIGSTWPAMARRRSPPTNGHPTR